MLKHKRLRNRGKISFSRFFQKFQEGDYVAVARDLTIPFPYSKRVQGRTGTVIEKRGSCYYVEIKDLNKPKRYLIKPIHLKKIEVQTKNDTK
jgi:ribosomal protein L21E